MYFFFLNINYFQHSSLILRVKSQFSNLWYKIPIFWQNVIKICKCKQIFWTVCNSLIGNSYFGLFITNFFINDSSNWCYLLQGNIDKGNETEIEKSISWSLIPLCDTSKELDNKYHTLEPTYPSKYSKGLTPVLLPFSCVCVTFRPFFKCCCFGTKASVHSAR